jgi:hypothetical protein
MPYKHTLYFAPQYVQFFGGIERQNVHANAVPRLQTFLFEI